VRGARGAAPVWYVEFDETTGERASAEAEHEQNDRYKRDIRKLSQPLPDCLNDAIHPPTTVRCRVCHRVHRGGEETREEEMFIDPRDGVGCVEAAACGKRQLRRAHTSGPREAISTAGEVARHAAVCVWVLKRPATRMKFLEGGSRHWASSRQAGIHR